MTKFEEWVFRASSYPGLMNQRFDYYKGFAQEATSVIEVGVSNSGDLTSALLSVAPGSYIGYSESLLPWMFSGLGAFAQDYPGVKTHMDVGSGTIDLPYLNDDELHDVVYYCFDYMLHLPADTVLRNADKAFLSVLISTTGEGHERMLEAVNLLHAADYESRDKIFVGTEDQMLWSLIVVP
jgi:hypothetical protein